MSSSPDVGPEPRASTDPDPATTPADSDERGRARDESTVAHDLEEVQQGKPERAFNIGVTVGVLLTAAAAIFVLQNRQSTTFDWLWFDFELPLWAALVGGVLVGVVLVVTILAVRVRHQRRIGRRRSAAERLRHALGRDRGPVETRTGRTGEVRG
jgi:uncharacterized integral membrane protein